MGSHMTNLPDKLCRKAVKKVFDKLSNETWEYLFDHDKENGLSECRTQGWGVKKVWYSTSALMTWLVDRGYYLPSEFDESSAPLRTVNHWSALQT